jgi:hypothetical protein
LIAAPQQAAEVVVAPEDPRKWCEPLDPAPCLTDAHCTATADGIPQVCIREWWVPHSEARVCVARMPNKRIRRWRSARLRVLVNEICKPGEGCSPSALHSYLSVLALRESTWRPDKVHRLVGDREAASVAWRKMSEVYVNSPAYDEPWRWVGRGYYGQNSAYLTARWDVTAVPEILCGEVESTLVHLRTARERQRRLTKGVTCMGIEHHGTAADASASWYDISLVNSGSNPCPGSAKIRTGFEKRAKSRGLDPYGAVTLRALGRPVPHDEQDAFARRMRAEMDRQHPRP